MKSKEQLTYYNGFSDGVHACNMATIAMIEKVMDLTDIKQIKLVVAYTGQVLADIGQETNTKLDQLLKQVQEESTNGME